MPFRVENVQHSGLISLAAHDHKEPAFVIDGEVLVSGLIFGVTDEFESLLFCVLRLSGDKPQKLCPLELLILFFVFRRNRGRIIILTDN